MRFIGLYDELGPGMGYPSMKDSMAAEPYENQTVIANYLRGGKVHMVTAAHVTDVVTGRKKDIELCHMNDGVFSWTTSILYHVEKYNLRLPAEFVTHVISKLKLDQNNTAVVTQEWKVDSYTVLTLNRMPQCDYNRYRIRDKVYDVVPVYDLPGAIAIVTPQTEAFVGATVEFVMIAQE